MHLGALSSLAEVGIGVNLAFSAVGHFRRWLEELVQKGVTAATAKVGTALAELDGKPRSIERIEQMAPRFCTRAAAIQKTFILFAVLSAIALTGFLAYAAVHGNDPCTDWMLAPTMLLVAGPIGLWVLVLGGDYLVVRFRLWWIAFDERRSIRKVRELLGSSVRPTEPDSTNDSSADLK